MLDFENLGICSTDANKLVLFQNNICKEICGNQTSEVCNICTNFTYNNKQNYSISFLPKLHFCKRQTFPNGTCDVYKLSEKNYKELTILIPVSKFLNKYLHLLKNKKFTPREIEVAILILDHKSNAEIQDELFISKSTLKTHLNHMYLKLPDLKSFRLKK